MKYVSMKKKSIKKGGAAAPETLAVGSDKYINMQKIITLIVAGLLGLSLLRDYVLHIVFDLGIYTGTLETPLQSNVYISNPAIMIHGFLPTMVERNFSLAYKEGFTGVTTATTTGGGGPRITTPVAVPVSPNSARILPNAQVASATTVNTAQAIPAQAIPTPVASATTSSATISSATTSSSPTAPITIGTDPEKITINLKTLTALTNIMDIYSFIKNKSLFFDSPDSVPMVKPFTITTDLLETYFADKNYPTKTSILAEVIQTTYQKIKQNRIRTVGGSAASNPTDPEYINYKIETLLFFSKGTMSCKLNIIENMETAIQILSGAASKTSFQKWINETPIQIPVMIDANDAVSPIALPELYIQFQNIDENSKQQILGDMNINLGKIVGGGNKSAYMIRPKKRIYRNKRKYTRRIKIC